MAKTETVLKRVTPKGAYDYERLRLRYSNRSRKYAFLEELCEEYEKSKRSQLEAK